MENEQLTFEFQPAKRPSIKGFPELHWTGKRPYTSTQYYPAQLRERYGDEQNEWINKIFWGDNLQVMSHLLKDYRGGIKLIYIDPPFDSKADYKKKIEVKGIGKAESDSSSFEEKQYGDIWTNDEYLQFIYERLLLMRELLASDGSLYIHLDEKRSHYVKIILDEVFGQECFKRELIWSTKTSSGFKAAANNWVRTHDTIFFYSKGNGESFNKQYWDYGDEYKARFRKKDENGRLYRDDRGSGIKQYLDELKGIPMGDVWDDIMSFQQAATSGELLGYPTQKPEKLIERIMLASSNPGDLVFDCFMGSGTTQAVAMKLGRRFIGADINLGAIQTTTKRLISVAKELNAQQKAAPQLTLFQGGKQADDEDEGYLAAASAGGNDELSAEEKAQVAEYFKSKGVDVNLPQEDVKYTGFEVYNVNNYDFFRNPVEARDLIIQALEIQPFPQSSVWDGELDGRMVKIMPVNRIATKADLEELKANLSYKTYEKRREENPKAPVELITIVCMGHEPDLKASLEQELSDYKLDINIVDILRDKSDLELKREAEAEIVREGSKLVIRQFYPMNLMQKLSLQKEYVEDWRQLVESVMIDWNYDGVVMQPTVMDVPDKKEMVTGVYDVPDDAGTIKVKITDLLSESIEVEV
ncbi:MAG: site-specific DNA-methyltransferase [[Eubacterium] siraeum]